jgi:hypothetical protein
LTCWLFLRQHGVKHTNGSCSPRKRQDRPFLWRAGQTRSLRHSLLMIQGWKNNFDTSSAAAACRAHKILEQIVALANQGILRAPPTLEDYHQSSLNPPQSVDNTLQLLLDLKKKQDLDPTETTPELIVLSVLANGGHDDLVKQLLEEVRNKDGLRHSEEM